MFLSMRLLITSIELGFGQLSSTGCVTKISTEWRVYGDKGYRKDGSGDVSILKRRMVPRLRQVIARSLLRGSTSQTIAGRLSTTPVRSQNQIFMCLPHDLGPHLKSASRKISRI